MIRPRNEQPDRQIWPKPTPIMIPVVRTSIAPSRICVLRRSCGDTVMSRRVPTRNGLGHYFADSVRAEFCSQIRPGSQLAVGPGAVTSRAAANLELEQAHHRHRVGPGTDPIFGSHVLLVDIATVAEPPPYPRSGQVEQDNTDPAADHKRDDVDSHNCHGSQYACRALFQDRTIRKRSKDRGGCLCFEAGRF